MRSKLHFDKLVGAGNDFILFDGRNSQQSLPAKEQRPAFVKKLSDRNFGIGSDGVVFLESETQNNQHSDIRWDFYNPDGSSAEMCGNAARCVGSYLARIDKTAKSAFWTEPGLIQTEVMAPDLVAVRMDFLDLTITPVPSQVSPEVSAALINTGVPHIVVVLKRLEDANSMADLIQEMRHHPVAGPRGSNVTFLEIKGPASFRTVTFERGVEGFTLACGTGVLAAATAGLVASGGRHAQVEAPGGMLEVDFANEGSGVILTGPAKHVFSGELAEELMP